MNTFRWKIHEINLMLVVIVAQQIYLWTRQRAASCTSVSRRYRGEAYKYLNRTPDARVSRVWAAIIKASIKIRRTLSLLSLFFSRSFFPCFFKYGNSFWMKLNVNCVSPLPCSTTVTIRITSIHSIIAQ